MKSRAQRVRWMWFGLRVDQVGHVHLRQVHVFSYSAPWGDRFAVEHWSRGIDGKLWHCGTVETCADYGAAKLTARLWIEQFCRGYVTVEEVESEGTWTKEERQQAKGQAAGGGVETWWADVLRVDRRAGMDEIKAAYRVRVMQTHPDVNPGIDEDEIKRVNAAWEYIQRGGQR